MYSVLAVVGVVASLLTLGQVSYPTGFIPYFADCDTRALPPGVMCYNASGVRIGGQGGGPAITLPVGGAVGGGAPTDAVYVTGTANATLSAERVTTNSTTITWNTGTAGQIAAERAALTGAVTASANSNTTSIAANAVGNTEAADMPANTIKGNNTGSTGNPVDMTVAQAKTLLNYTPADIGASATGHVHAAGDVTSGTLATARLGSGTADGTTFLRGDQTWAVPSGGSDPWTNVILGSDFNNSTTTVSAVTGLSFTPAANTRYLIEGYFLLRTAVNTTGARPGMNFPTGMSDGAGFIEGTNSATGGVQRFFGITGVNTIAASTGLANATESWPGICWAYIITGPTPSGTFQITLASEVAASQVTMRAGSFIRYRTIQ